MLIIHVLKNFFLHKSVSHIISEDQKQKGKTECFLQGQYNMQCKFLRKILFKQQIFYKQTIKEIK